jgi:hypothetical protein
MSRFLSIRRSAWAFLPFLLLRTAAASAQEAVSLQERFAVGYAYHVSTRVDLTGTLTPPAEPGKTAPAPIQVRGDSAIEYDERILAVGTDGQVNRTLRAYARMDFRRTVGDRPQEANLRPAVRRMVLMRDGPRKAPFSPDGPLTWGEIDQVRTDTLTPLLVGLLPDHPVKPGDTWEATALALQELTDIAQPEVAKMSCRLESVQREGRRLAHVVFTGEVRGMNEDGPTRHVLRGHYDFDLDAGCLSYLLLNGTQSLQDRDGREVGRVEGRFVLSRRQDVRNPLLGDEALRSLKLEPDADNTRLLYDNPNRGVRFVYPRRWRTSESRPNQLSVTGPGGVLLLTTEPQERTPSAAQFLAESREFLQNEKARVVRVEPPQAVAGVAGLERFVLEAEAEGRKVLRVYYILRTTQGGVLIAADLSPTDPEAPRDLDRLVRSLTLTRKLP